MNHFYDRDGEKHLYITPRELALVLRASERTIQRWIAEEFFVGRAWPGLSTVIWVGDGVDKKPMLDAVTAKVKVQEKGYPVFALSAVRHAT